MEKVIRGLCFAALLAACAVPTSAREYKKSESSRNSKSQVLLDVRAARSILKADEKQNAWVRVGMDGFKLDSGRKRTPVNVALVLDKSGSMQGEKIARAREAAISAIRRLRPEDIVSVITYDSTVNVLVPATKLTDRDYVIAAIGRIQAGGSTALFAGVSKGATEIRKFADDNNVSRIVLLSDGKANVGPKTPGELGDLGASLMKENIAVTTLGLGLGFNEDLMVQLASRSGGNHEFIENASELADIFNQEFDSVTSVVAQQIEMRITVPEGIRPVRVLGNDAEINGQQIFTKLSSIYSEQNKHVVLELEVPKSGSGSKRDLATVSVSYLNMKTQMRDTLTGRVDVTFSNDESAVSKSLNANVMADVAALVANETNKLATKFLDEGDHAQCIILLNRNSAYLKENSALAPGNKKLQALYRLNRDQVGQVSRRDTNRARKSMRESQYKVESQQALERPPKK